MLSVATELRFTRRRLPFPSGALSLAERVRPGLAGPVVAGLHSLAASSLGADDPPDEDAFVCGDDRLRRLSGSSSPVDLTTGRALDAGRSRAPARSKGLTAVIVNMNRRYKGHAGIKVTGLA